MFEKNDKSLYLVRRILDVAIFVLMCVSVLAGIVLIATSFRSDNYGTYIIFGSLIGGVLSILLGPVLLQLVWLAIDIRFNSLLDVKIIRNAQFGNGKTEFFRPLFSKKRNCDLTCEYDAYEKLKKFKALLDEEVISADEYESIKKELLGKNECTCTVEEDISKVKTLKTYVDDKILTEEEFKAEKAKILNK